MSKTYRVVMRGVKDGFAREKVVAELATLFKKKPEQVGPLLDAKRAVVKKGITLAMATTYQEALERCGCACAVETDAAFAADATQIMPRYSPGDEEEVFGTRALASGNARSPVAAAKAEQPEPARPPVSAGVPPEATPAAAKAGAGDVAKYRSLVLLGIGVNAIGVIASQTVLGAMLALPVVLASGVFILWAVYRLCQALELAALPWLVVMFVPLLNLVGSVLLIRKASGVLKARALGAG